MTFTEFFGPWVFGALFTAAIVGLTLQALRFPRR
jgi:hypothetical protein